MNKVAVYGCTGFIGSRFCDLYENYVAIPRGGFSSGSDDVVYFISTTDNYNVFNDPYKDINTNLTVLIDKLEKFKGSDKVFNFISSWFVYGDAVLPPNEESPCNPKGFYSITKRCAEQLLISYCTTFGIKYRILRLSSVYGPKDKPSSKKNAIQYMVELLKSNKDIQLYNNGEFYRELTYVDDIVSALGIIINKGELDSVYNVGTGVATKFGDIIYSMKDYFNSSSNIEIINPSSFHKTVQVKDMYMNVDKLKSLGFEAKYIDPIKTLKSMYQ